MSVPDQAKEDLQLLPAPDNRSGKADGARRAPSANGEDSMFSQGPLTLEKISSRLEEAATRHARLGEELSLLRSALQRELGAAEVPRALPMVARLGIGLAPGQVPVSPGTGSLEPENHATFDAGLMRQLSAEQLDGLPYGVIVLDSKGRVVNYNDTESRMVGLPRESVIGRLFFGEVAPCARVKEFEGRFLQLVNGQSAMGIETFEFVFHFARGSQRVLIMISPGRQRSLFNVCMIRK